ncbi:MAG: hypothetical protein ABID79_00895 [Elusimicrobiota bacterium]
MSQQNKKIILIFLLLLWKTTFVSPEMNIDSSSADPFYIDRFENELKEQQEKYRKNKLTEKKKPIVVEPFCKNLSQNVTWWQLTAEEIQIIKNKGLGFTELIKIILISKKTVQKNCFAIDKLDKSTQFEKKLPTEIIRRRNRGETFLKICSRYNLDYNDIKNETKKIMSEIYPIKY